MRKIVYAVAMSLDGYVAGPRGEVDWIVIDPELDFSALFQRFDTVLLGRKTFQAAQSRGGGGGMPGLRTVVVSRTLPPPTDPAVTLISADIPAALHELRSQPGKDIWLFGGGSLFASLLQWGLVDAVEVSIIPILLGGGIPFLPAPAARACLRLVNSRIYPTTGTASLEYAVEAEPRST